MKVSFKTVHCCEKGGGKLYTSINNKELASYSTYNTENYTPSVYFDGKKFIFGIKFGDEIQLIQDNKVIYRDKAKSIYHSFDNDNNVYLIRGSNDYFLVNGTKQYEHDNIYHYYYDYDDGKYILYRVEGKDGIQSLYLNDILLFTTANNKQSIEDMYFLEDKVIFFVKQDDGLISDEHMFYEIKLDQ